MTTEAQAATGRLSSEVAAEIRAAMGRLQVRQSQLARRIGRNEQWLSVRLRGVQEIGLDDLQAIAAALGVPPVALLPTSARAGTPSAEPNSGSAIMSPSLRDQHHARGATRPRDNRPASGPRAVRTSRPLGGGPLSPQVR